MESKPSSNPSSTLPRFTKQTLNPNDPHLNDIKEKENEQIMFLKQLVSRLNAELARCRNLGKIAGDPTPLSDLLSSGDALWLWDASTLSPLLQGQDEYIAELQKKVAEYEKHIPALKNQCQLLVAENERLHKHFEQQPQVDSETSYNNDITSRFLSQQNQQLRKVLQQARMDLETKSTSLNTSQETVKQLEQTLSQRQTHLLDLQHELDTTLVSLHRLESRQKELEHAHEQCAARTSYWETRAHQYEAYLSDLVHQHHQLMMDFQEVTASAASTSHKKAVQDLLKMYSEHLPSLLHVREDHDDVVIQLDVARAENQALLVQLDDLRQRHQATQEMVASFMESSMAKQEWVQYKAQCQSLLEGYKQHQAVLVEKEAKQRYQMERAIREKRMVESSLNKLQEEMKLDKERMAMELAAIHSKIRNESKLHVQLKNDYEILKAKHEMESMQWQQEKQIQAKDLDHQVKLVRRAFSDLEKLKDENQGLVKKLEDANKAYNAMVASHLEELRQLKFPHQKQLARKSDPSNTVITSKEPFEMPSVLGV